MSNLNKIILIANIGQRPNLKQGQDGGYYTNFSVCYNEKLKNEAGHHKSECTWFNVTAWGKNAENICKYLDAGSLIYLEGKVRLNKYTNHKNEPEASLQVSLSSFTMLPNGDRNSGQNQSQNFAQHSGQNQGQNGQPTSPNSNGYNQPVSNPEMLQNGHQNNNLNQSQQAPNSNGLNNGANVNNHQPNTNGSFNPDNPWVG